MAAKLYDVLVIGGGPSGLSVAVSLARQTYQAVVFDSGVYRNARATHMHNVAGFDHVPPAEYRAKVRADLAARYDSTTFVSAEVLRVERLAPDGPGAGVPASTLFRAVTADGGSWLGRKVVLATGVTDIPVPDIAGYDDCFGRGIFHCLFCHGYEERGVDSVGVFAVGNMAPAQTAMHIAYMAKPLGKHVRIYTHGEAEVSASLEAKAAEAGFALETRKIRAVRMSGKGHEVVITLDDGEEITEGFVAHAPKTRANGPFASQLGLETTETGDIKATPPFGETSVPGVLAVGDCALPMKAVPMAAASGTACTAGLVSKLAAEPIPSVEGL